MSKQTRAHCSVKRISELELKAGASRCGGSGIGNGNEKVRVHEGGLTAMEVCP